MNALMPAGRPADRVTPDTPPTCEPSPQATTTVVPPSASRPRARLSRQLSDRDREILASLATLRLATGAQLQRLHVADGSQATRARRARALLQRLADLKLVVRLGRSVGGVRAGSSGYVYGLSGNGQAVLATTGPMGGRRRRVWETSPSFQDHVLAVADVYVDLVEAERIDRVELLAFEAEPPCWRKFPGGNGESVMLKPDAFVRLGLGELERSAFVEVDLGTESGPTIARKCGVYAAYWRSGIEQQRHGVFPSVLWLANNERGLARITEVLRRLPRDVQHIFEVALLGDALTTLTTTAPGGRMS